MEVTFTMAKSIITLQLKIKGMSCSNCEQTIENQLCSLKGVKKVSVSYNTSSCELQFDPQVITKQTIIKKIEAIGYSASEFTQTKKQTKSNELAVAIAIVLIFILFFNHFQLGRFFNAFPTISQDMELGMLFIVGLLTSFHCVAMCGGINLSQCLSQVANQEDSKKAAFKASAQYNIGRVLSYTIIGGIVGGIGTVFSFSISMQGFIQLFAGIFMIIMGLNLLSLFPSLKKLTLRLPKSITTKVRKQTTNRTPLVIGLLNGFMPCGPLQAMQLFALATQDPFKGALAMFLFSLGTIPLMFSFGALSSFINKKTSRYIMQVGAIIVIVLGISMFQNGLSLSGINTNIIASNNDAKNNATSQVKDGVQYVNTTLSAYGYEAINVQPNIPVKWTIYASQEDITGCNNKMVIPAYGIEHTFVPGENVIEFIPKESGSIPYSCWMGMIRSQINVGDSNTPSTTSEESSIPSCHS